MLLAAVLALHLPPVVSDVPNKQPQVAVSKDTVALAFGSADSLYLSLSHDAGRTFAPAAKIATLPKVLVGRHRGPRVVISGNTMIVSAISTDLYAWRSTDGGKTWSKPVIVNDKPAAAREGLHAMTADASGHLAAVWLDDRDPGGKWLWGAFSNDGGATWSKNVKLHQGTICECCHPSLLATGPNEFAVMWRNNLDGSRDFYVLKVRDGKVVGAPVKQGEGTWKLEACPMDGGGIASHNGEIVTAWRREKEIYLARPGKAEVKLGPGQDVALAANAKGEYAVWNSAGSIVALVPGASTPEKLAAMGGFPTIVALPDGAMLAAWEDHGAIATKRLE
jgi:hypothetical protein